ncbi:MAG TPA: hypothetical protein DEH78_11105 [Solibacterales bacterium]|nr:hypothetical protein [Bryobacterales bacterium]
MAFRQDWFTQKRLERIARDQAERQAESGEVRRRARTRPEDPPGLRRKISFWDARRHFAAVLDYVVDRSEPVVVMRTNRRDVAIIPASELAAYLESRSRRASGGAASAEPKAA